MGSIVHGYAPRPAAPRGALGRHIRYAITRDWDQLEDPEAHAPRACKQGRGTPSLHVLGAVSQLYAALCVGVLIFVPL
jgi:hypothetical protein